MILLDLFTFLGHLHPVVVHLPLGFLLLAFIFHLLAGKKKLNHLQQAVPFILLAGFIAAVLACIFGYILSLAGDYDRQLLRNHKWSGIWLSVFSGILCIAAFGKFFKMPRNIFTICFAVLIGLIAYSGHNGGSLTHGREYLTLKTLTHQKRMKPASLDEAYIFEDVIQPMLQAKCAQCHAGGKLKGEFSVESLADLLKGGKHGAAVVAGKPMESELYKRITLPASDEKFMPSDGKPALKKNEIEIIRWWIEKANAAEGQKFLSINNKDSVAAKVSAFLGLTMDEAEDEEILLQHTNPDIPQSLDTNAVNNLRKKGWMVRWMLQKPAMLDVTRPLTGNSTIKEAIPDLEKLAKNIIWLNVSENNLSDNDLSFLTSLINLEKLRIEKNPVTDAVCDRLKTLPHLEAVNLNETKVTANGIVTLRKNEAIRRVYTGLSIPAEP